MSTETNTKNWVLGFLLAWGAMGILGGSHGYLTKPTPPPTPQILAYAPMPQLSNQHTDARDQFLFLTNQLGVIHEQLIIQSYNLEVVDQISAISNRLDDLPDDLPWDIVMKERLEATIALWSMSDALENKEDEAGKDTREAVELAVSKLVEVLESLCAE